VSKRDYYEVLGVERQTDAAALKKAYRALARRFHPDSSEEPDAAERFKEATEAYSVLSDPQKRQRYDTMGHAGVEGGAGFDPSAFTDFGDLFSVFGQVFGMDFGGGGGGASRPRRGDDLLLELEVDFEDAALGVERDVEVPRLTHCGSCQGAGAAPGTGRSTCGTCGGRGQVIVRQGIFSLGRPCGDCQGAGSTLESPCEDCGGAGRRPEEKTLKLRIPAGVDDGQRIRVGGEGEAGPNGGPPGDLYVQLRVAAHDFFERDGADLHLRLPLSFPQVALGAKIEVPTLAEPAELSVPSGTEAGEVFRLRGKGIPRLGRGGQGDLFVHVRVRTPKKLSGKQADLLREYADSLDETYELEEEKSFLERVKSLFGGS
jgi:molecular chaperone DnaJ